MIVSAKELNELVTAILIREVEPLKREINAIKDVLRQIMDFVGYRLKKEK